MSERDAISTAPVASRFRATAASAFSFTAAIPTAAPTATLSPAASAPASVFTVLVWSALTRPMPDAVKVVSLAPSRAIVSLSTMEMATEAEMELLPVLPACVSVVIAWEPTASMVKSATPPPTGSPSWISADVGFVTLFSATDAPTPTLPPTAPPRVGFAFAALSVNDCALMFSAPASVTPFVPPWRIFALVDAPTRLIATDPATPTFPAPAPEVASAENVWVAVSSPTRTPYPP